MHRQGITCLRPKLAAAFWTVTTLGTYGRGLQGFSRLWLGSEGPSLTSGEKVKIVGRAVGHLLQGVVRADRSSRKRTSLGTGKGHE